MLTKSAFTVKTVILKNIITIQNNCCYFSQGVKTFEQNEDVYIFLVLPKYNIFFI